MLASLAIDLLSVCTVMLAFGWAYDVVHGSTSVQGRNAHLRTLVADKTPKRTISHA